MIRITTTLLAAASISRSISPPGRSSSVCGKRRGYLYVAVLFTTLLVSTVGMVALANAALRMRSSLDQRDYLAAQSLAVSAIERGLYELQSTADWRSSWEHDAEYPEGGLTFGQGKLSWKWIDDDGSLDDDDSDSVRLVGIGRVGKAVVAESVRLLPSGEPLPCLESSLHCDGDFIVTGALLRFSTRQHISSNGNISVGGLLTSLDGNAEAAGTVSGAINGESISGATTRRMPGSAALDYYIDNGTRIDISALPLVDGRRQITRCILSNATNPFGELNPEGIYVIDCQGQSVRINNCRLKATLVLLDPAANSSVSGAVRWDAAVANFPALLVRGSIRMELSTAVLSESSLGMNFNPPNDPYSGIFDNDTQDSYPSELNGLVYVSENLNAAADASDSLLRGVVICGTFTAASNCHFTYRSLLLDHPPPGFSSGNPMLVSPGSRRRETLQVD